MSRPPTNPATGAGALLKIQDEASISSQKLPNNYDNTDAERCLKQLRDMGLSKLIWGPIESTLIAREAENKRLREALECAKSQLHHNWDFFCSKGFDDKAQHTKDVLDVCTLALKNRGQEKE